MLSYFPHSLPSAVATVSSGQEGDTVPHLPSGILRPCVYTWPAILSTVELRPQSLPCLPGSRRWDVNCVLPAFSTFSPWLSPGRWEWGMEELRAEIQKQRRWFRMSSLDLWGDPRGSAHSRGSPECLLSLFVTPRPPSLPFLPLLLQKPGWGWGRVHWDADPH